MKIQANYFRFFFGPDWADIYWYTYKKKSGYSSVVNIEENCEFMYAIFYDGILYKVTFYLLHAIM